MLTSISLEDAQSQLPKLIQEMPSGSRVEVTSHGVTVATITREAAWPSVPGTVGEQPRPAGTAKDRILWMAEDFNAPLDDFDEDAE